MAATNGQHQDQYPEELRSSLQRLNLQPKYGNIPLFQVFNSPLGGRGLQARRNIPFGTPIISEPMLFSKSEHTNLTRAQERNRKFQELLCPFQPATAAQRFDANAFTISHDRHRNKVDGIFMESSRFNHSCVPNAFFAWNAESRRLTVHAIGNIQKGQEIFVNYYADDYSKPRDKRRAALSTSYNFNCNCRACDPRLGSGLQGDQRRRQLHNLWDHINDNRDSRNPAVRSQILTNIETFITSLNKEGLIYPHMAYIYSEASWWYHVEVNLATKAAENSRYREACLEAALRFAREQLFLDVACNGRDSPVVKETLDKIAGLTRINISSHSHDLRSSRR